MGMKRALQVALGISLFGLVFSGVLSYQELFGSSALVCPSPGTPGTLFGYPACVYGFFMYLALVVTTSLGLVQLRALHVTAEGREVTGR